MCGPSSSELRARSRRPESRSRHVAVVRAHTKVLLQRGLEHSGSVLSDASDLQNSEGLCIGPDLHGKSAGLNNLCTHQCE